MKKNLLLIVAAFVLGFGGYSQITIQAEDVLDVNTIICLAKDSLPDASINPGTAGVDQTWDFSALAVKSQDTIAFIDPAFSPYDASFADDNIAAFMNNDMWSYFRKTSSVFETVGAVGDVFGTGSPLTIEFDPRETIIAYPFTYEDSIGGTTGFEIVVDTIKAIMTTNYTMKSDAWGSVITPFGTYDALRIYKTKIETTEIFLLVGTFWIPVNSATDTTYSFEWWSNNSATKYPVVSFDWLPEADSIDGDVEFLQNMYTLNSEISSKNNVSVFPNPSSGIVYVENLSGTKLELTNVSGKVLITKDIEGHGKTELNLENISSGLYFLKIYDEKGFSITKILIE